MNSKKWAAGIVAPLLMTGCASTPLPEMEPVASAKQESYQFGYEVVGMNQGLSDVQAFDDGQQTFFIFPAGVEGKRGFSPSDVSVPLRSVGSYWMAPEIRETWMLTNTSSEVYCVTKQRNAVEHCENALEKVRGGEVTAPAPRPSPAQRRVRTKDGVTKIIETRPRATDEGETQVRTRGDVERILRERRREEGIPEPERPVEQTVAPQSSAAPVVDDATAPDAPITGKESLKQLRERLVRLQAQIQKLIDQLDKETV